MEFSQLEERKISYRHKDSIVPVEFIEKIEWELYLRSLKVPYAQDIQNFVKQFGSYIKSEMRDRVDVYLDHYIQYKTTPEIDAFFHILASYRCKSLLHTELFNHDLKFGGVKFEKYVEAVTWIISFSLKHAWFCQELLLKRPHLQLMNIVTYMTETNQIIRDLSLCMEIDYKEAEIIFNTMCLDSSNIKSFQASTLPPFVRLSRGIVIRTMKGALANPFSFIMKEVRRKFQYEWDRSVDEREVRFRNEFLELLASIPGIVGAIDPLIIKEGKKVKTDIDAIFFNIKTGSLALIQLKWQDPFGGLSERYSRKSNFILNGNKWVQSVSDWIAEVGPPGVLKATRLDQVKGLKLNTIHLFVVGRYFSDFSGIDERDSRSAWTNWARLTKVVQTNLSNENFLKDPILWMREKFSTQNRVIIKEAYGSSIMKIHDYEIDFPDLDLKKIMEKLT